MGLGFISGALGIGSAILGNRAADKAARAQEQAGQQQLAFSRETRDMQRSDLAPFRNAGVNALDAYRYEMNLGPQPTFGGTAPQVERVRIGGGQVQGYQPEFRQTDINGDPIERLLKGPALEAWLERKRASGLDRNTAQGGGGYEYRVGDRTFATEEEARAFADANAVDGQAYERGPEVSADLADYGFEYDGPMQFERYTPEEILALQDDFVKSPGYEFRLQEGLRGTEAGVATRQGAASGAAMKALNRYGQNFGSNEWNNFLNRQISERDKNVLFDLGERDFGYRRATGERAYQTGERDTRLNRLFSLAGMGQNAAAGQATAAGQAANNINNAFANIGNANAAGAIGGANAWQQGIRNGLGLYNYGREAGWFEDSPMLGR